MIRNKFENLFGFEIFPSHHMEDELPSRKRDNCRTYDGFSFFLVCDAFFAQASFVIDQSWLSDSREMNHSS